MRPERMLLRQRFRFADVQHCAGKLSFIERLQQVFLYQVPSSPHVDHGGAARQSVEQWLGEDAAGAVGQRQQADQDVGACQEFLQAIGAGIAFDTLDLLRRPAPARAGKAETMQAFQHRASQHAEPQHADTSRRRRTHTMRLPAFFALLVEIGAPVTMNGKYGKRHVLDHAIDDTGLDHAHHRQRLGNHGIIEMIGAGAGREQDLEIRKPGGQVFGRLPRGQVAYFARIADIGPDAEGQLRHLAGEQLRPFGTAYRIGFIKEGHARLHSVEGEMNQRRGRSSGKRSNARSSALCTASLFDNAPPSLIHITHET